MRIEIFELLFGMIYLSAGVAGLIPAALIPPPADAPALAVNVLYGYALGLFPVNVLETALHLAVGVWGILGWRGVARSRGFARSLAVVAAALAVLGLIPGLNTLFGLMPLYGHDIWLHGVTAAVAAYFGWREPASMKDRRHILGDRRQRLMPIGSERRFGLADRREGFGGMAPGF